MRFRLIIVVLLLVFATIVSAQSEPFEGVIGVREDNLLLVTAEGEQVIAETDASSPLYPLDANSRGDVLYMIATNPNSYYMQGTLMLYDGIESRLLTDAFLLECPPYFSDDDHIIYVSTAIGENYDDENGSSFIRLPVVQHNLITNTTEQISSINMPLSGGGGGGSNIAMDSVFLDEYIFSGWSSVPNLFTVVDDITLSGNWKCHGGLSTTQDGTTSQFAPRQNIVALSPDNSHVFVITDEGFDIINITTGLVTIGMSSDWLNGTTGAYWAEDGFIYVNTLAQQTPAYTLSEDEINSLRDQLGSWDWVYSNQAHIYRIDSQTGETTRIHEATNIWAITRLNSLDGYLYWAELPDGTAVINDFRAGVFSNDYDRYTLIDNYLLPHIYRMPLAGGEIELVAEDLQRFIPISSN